MRITGWIGAGLLVLCASVASAQETGTETGEAEAPAASEGLGLELGEVLVEGRRLGEEYVKETYGDWAIQCVTTENDEDPCTLYQLMEDEAGNAISEISLVKLPEGQEAAAGANVVTPLETLLPRQLTIQVDSGQARRFPFTFCTQVGCIARIGLTDADITAMKRGASATVTIVPVAAPNQPVQVTMSLTGFTAGFDAL
ncbi:MAG: invasion associated locus B family protein [Shimia sp.]